MISTFRPLSEPVLRRIRFCLIKMNHAAEHIIPSIAIDYPTWGYLYETVDAITTPTSSHDTVIHEPAHYSNLAANLIRHHDAIQHDIRATGHADARTLAVRGHLMQAHQAATEIAELLSNQQLANYHRFISSEDHTDRFELARS